MYKLFHALLVIIWIIDILNLNFQVGNIWTAEFLDQTIPINTLAWILIWIFIPSSTAVVEYRRGE